MRLVLFVVVKPSLRRRRHAAADSVAAKVAD